MATQIVQNFIQTLVDAGLADHLATNLEIDVADVTKALLSFSASLDASEAPVTKPKAKKTTKKTATKKSKAKEVEADAEADADAEIPLEKMTVAQLKELCKAKKLSDKGKKADLVARLSGGDADAEAEDAEVEAPKKTKAKTTKKAKKVSEPEPEEVPEDADAEASESKYANMSIKDLKEELGNRKLKKTGNKEELIARLEDHDAANVEDAAEVEEE